MSTGTKVTTETEMDTCKYTVKYISPDILGTKYYYFCIFCEQANYGPAINCMIIDIITPNPTVISTA